MTKTIYVQDEQIWKEVQKKAKKEGKSVSQIIGELLSSYVTKNKADKPLYIG